MRPEFVLYPGDAIFGYQNTREEMLRELDDFAVLADTAAVPVYNAPGNHEMQSSTEAVETLLEWGHDLYGSFDFRHCHFVVLNTDEVALEGRITGEQLEWLREDLAAARGARATFVVMHRPMHSWFQGDFNPDDGGGAPRPLPLPRRRGRVLRPRPLLLRGAARRRSGT